MNIRNLKSMVIAFALIAVGIGCARADGIPWVASWSDAQAQARQSNKLLMVDVYTDWCGWCKKLDADVYPDPSVMRAAAQFIPVRLNAEKEGQQVAQYYHVTGYPTILFITQSGAVVHQIVGYEAAADFAAELNSVAQSTGSGGGGAAGMPGQAPNTAPTPSQPSPVTQDPISVSQAVQRAVHMVQRSQYAEATSVVTQLEQLKENAQLGPLYNKLGDVGMRLKQSGTAAAWFQRTLQFSKSPKEVAYAHLQLARCEIALKSRAKAHRELTALIALPNAPVSYKNKAVAMLKGL